MTVVLAAIPWNVIIVQVFAFALLAFFIVKFGFPVLRKALASRQQEVADTFSRLERETKEASDRIAELKTRLGGMDQEAKQRFQQALDEGAKAKAQSLAEANAQATAELEKAKRSIMIERDKAVLELRTEIAHLTLESAEKLIDGMMNEKLHGRIVEWTLEGMEKAVKSR
jgi:F-type H+-transporting ATPase subunit b